MKTDNYSITIIFPNQLFKDSLIVNEDVKKIYLIEEYLFFKHYKFHKQKITYHRSSMKKYYDYLKTKNFKVQYINSFDKKSDIRFFMDSLDDQVTDINIYNPVDDWLLKRINNHKKDINIHISNNPLFINTDKQLSTFSELIKKIIHMQFSISSKGKKLNILMDSDDNPVGGKYSFDSDNRKSIPKMKSHHILFSLKMIIIGLKRSTIQINTSLKITEIYLILNTIQMISKVQSVGLITFRTAV